MKKRNGFPLALAVAVAVTPVAVPAMPQEQPDHHFADKRQLLSIAIVLGAHTCFEQRAEHWPGIVFFLGLMLSTVGSCCDHLGANDESLFWDRLPMIIAFMGLLRPQIVERALPRAMLLMAALNRSRDTRGNDLYALFAWYVLAKVGEHFGAEVLALTQRISEHTLKHASAAAAGFVACWMLAQRRLRTVTGVAR